LKINKNKKNDKKKIAIKLMGTKLDIENKWDKISRDEIKNKNKSRKWLKNKKKAIRITRTKINTNTN
jgi:hypothetical protein